jgi:quercetin dioxygenase-like cupin family protein
MMTESLADWQPSKAAQGVSFKTLRRDHATGGLTVLLRFEPGSRFPAHRHPAGEEVFVVEGQVKIGDQRLKQGDYLYAAPDSVHAVWSEFGCTILVMLPKPVEIVEK